MQGEGGGGFVVVSEERQRVMRGLADLERGLCQGGEMGITYGVSGPGKATKQGS